MEKIISPEAVRVLGVLIEKELSTPDYYPMTLNALVNGCNQKSNRDPVVEFGEFQIRELLDELNRARLTGHASVAGSRSEKFRHAADHQWELGAEALALMASLMLRGPQTVGELRSHTARMATFESMETVAEVLQGLMDRESPLVMSIGRAPGQKGERFAHLLCGPVDIEEVFAAGSGGSAVLGPGMSRSGMSGSVNASGALLEEIEALKSRLEALEAEFERFKSQFE